MTMQRWDPFRELRRMEERMNRVWRGAEWEEEGWTLPVDVTESTDKITVRASVPGVDPEAIHVTFENGNLAIRVERAEERKEEEGDYLIRERREKRAKHLSIKAKGGPRQVTGERKEPQRREAA